MRKRGILFGVVAGIAFGLALAALPAWPRSGGHVADGREAGTDSADEDRRPLTDFSEPLTSLIGYIKANFFEEVTNHQLLVGAYNGMLARVDRYGTYIPPELADQTSAEPGEALPGVGARIRFLPLSKAVMVDESTPGLPAFSSGMMTGDFIVEIIDPATGEKVETKSLETVADAVRMLRGEAGTELKATSVRVYTGERKELAIRRAVDATSRVHSAGLIAEEPKTGYIHVARFEKGTADDLRAALRELAAQGAEAVVVDLRFNPGGSLDEVAACADMFLSHGVIVRTRGRRRPEIIRAATAETEFAGLPVAMLANAYTSGTAEVFAAALRDNDRAVLVGTETLGRAGVQQVFRNPYDGSAVKLTTAYHCTPKGERIDEDDKAHERRSGVAPDLETEMPQGGLFRLATHLTKVLTEGASPRGLRQFALEGLLREPDAPEAEEPGEAGEEAPAGPPALDWIALPGRGSRDMAAAVSKETGQDVAGLREALSAEWVNVQFGPPEWYEHGPTGLRRALETKIAAVIDESPDVELTPELRQAVRTVIEQWVPADLGGPNALAEWPFGDMQLGRAVDALAQVVSGVQKAREAAWQAEHLTSNAA